MRLLAWLLPDASCSEQPDGWTRRDYRPRHGKPPLAVRGWHAAAGIALAAQRRYLEDLPEEESMTRVRKPGPEPSLVMANNSRASNRPRLGR
ncbi:MAG TPA: hypothetical protein VN767_09910 [Streptosporangiaceae bacterium]|nr:hypothetical protein [Streptosporangiaceae bacterium]